MRWFIAGASWSATDLKILESTFPNTLSNPEQTSGRMDSYLSNWHTSNQNSEFSLQQITTETNKKSNTVNSKRERSLEGKNQSLEPKSHSKWQREGENRAAPLSGVKLGTDWEGRSAWGPPSSSWGEEGEGFLDGSGTTDLLSLESWSVWLEEMGLSWCCLGFIKTEKPLQGQYGDLLKSLTFQLNSHDTETAAHLPDSLSNSNAELSAKSEAASAREGRARALEIVSKLTTENQSLIKAGGEGAVYNKLLKKSPPRAFRKACTSPLPAPLFFSLPRTSTPAVRGHLIAPEAPRWAEVPWRLDSK